MSDCAKCARLQKRIEKLQKQLIFKGTCRDKRRPFTWHEWRSVDRVRLEFNGDRIWLKLEGGDVFKAVNIEGRFMIWWPEIRG